MKLISSLLLLIQILAGAIWVCSPFFVENPFITPFTDPFLIICFLLGISPLSTITTHFTNYRR